MEVFVRIRTLTTSLVGLALVVAMAAPAAAQGSPVSTRPLLGAGVSILTDGSETGTAFAVDIAFPFMGMSGAALSGVADFGYHNFEGYSLLTYMPGARVTVTRSSRFQPFGQFLIGASHFSTSDCEGEGCSETDLTLAPGGGIDVRINDTFNFRGQVDFLIFKFPPDEEGEGSVWGNATRFTFGISMKLGG
jgi:hypothetical protein